MDNKIVYVIYYSRRGNTKALARRVQDVFRALFPKSTKIELMDITIDLDMDALKNASGYIFGSPDYFNYPCGLIKDIFDQIYEFRMDIKGRPAFGFLSHGGGGKGAKPLSELIKSIQLNEVGPIVSVKEDKINAKTESSIQKNCQKMMPELQYQNDTRI